MQYERHGLLPFQFRCCWVEFFCVDNHFLFTQKKSCCLIKDGFIDTLREVSMEPGRKLKVPFILPESLQWTTVAPLLLGSWDTLQHFVVSTTLCFLS